MTKAKTPEFYVINFLTWVAYLLWFLKYFPQRLGLLRTQFLFLSMKVVFSLKFTISFDIDGLRLPSNPGCLLLQEAWTPHHLQISLTVILCQLQVCLKNTENICLIVNLVKTWCKHPPSIMTPHAKYFLWYAHLARALLTLHGVNFFSEHWTDRSKCHKCIA